MDASNQDQAKLVAIVPFEPPVSIENVLFGVTVHDLTPSQRAEVLKLFIARFLDAWPERKPGFGPLRQIMPIGEIHIRGSRDSRPRTMGLCVLTDVRLPSWGRRVQQHNGTRLLLTDTGEILFASSTADIDGDTKPRHRIKLCSEKRLQRIMQNPEMFRVAVESLRYYLKHRFEEAGRELDRVRDVDDFLSRVT